MRYENCAFVTVHIIMSHYKLGSMTTPVRIIIRVSTDLSQEARTLLYQIGGKCNLHGIIGEVLSNHASIRTYE